MLKFIGSKIPDIPGAIGTGFGNLTGDEDLETVVNRVREKVVGDREPTGEVTGGEGPLPNEGPEQSSMPPPDRERGGEGPDMRTRQGERAPAGDAQQMTEMDGQTALTRGAQEEPSAEGRTALTQEHSQPQEEAHTTPSPSGVEQFQSQRLNKTINAENLFSLSRDEKKALIHEIWGNVDISDPQRYQQWEGLLMNKFRAMR